MMKRLISSILLCTIVIMVFSGCSKKSGIVLDDLKAMINDNIGDINTNFKETESDDGLYFSATTYDSLKNITVTCSTDNNKDIKIFTFTNMDVDPDLLSSPSKINAILSKSANQLTRNDIRSGYCIVEAKAIYELVAGEDVSMDLVYDMLANQKAISVNNWEILTTISDSGIVTIHAQLD